MGLVAQCLTESSLAGTIWTVDGISVSGPDILLIRKGLQIDERLLVVRGWKSRKTEPAPGTGVVRGSRWGARPEQTDGCAGRMPVVRPGGRARLPSCPAGGCAVDRDRRRVGRPGPVCRAAAVVW